MHQDNSKKTPPTRGVKKVQTTLNKRSVARAKSKVGDKSILRDKKLTPRARVKPMTRPPSQVIHFTRPPSKTIVKIKETSKEVVQTVNNVSKNKDIQSRSMKDNKNNTEEEENIIDTQVVSNVASQEPHRQEQEQLRNIQMKDLQAEDMQVIEDHCEDEIDSDDTNLVRINLRRCMYNVVENVARTLGMSIIRNETDDWDVYWSDYSVTTGKSKNMTMYQRINHFPGLANLESKAFLAFHLNRMRIQFPEQYNFFPKSWSLPFQQQECIAFLEQNPHEIYILKPSRGAEGKGIKIFSDVKEVQNNNIEATCQMYLTDILLLDGFKFDLRLYVLITSIDPLEIFVYENGLVRLATCPYDHPNMYNIHNQYMHLTNYSINKSSKDYDSTEEGSKRDFATLSRWLQTQRQDENKLWGDIDDIIIKTIISVHPILKDKYETLFPAHHKTSTKVCFEILGFDIILDSNMKPYLLEVNRSPSFNISGPVDSKVKRNLIYDTFKLLNLHTIPKTDEVSTDLGNYRRIYPTDKVFEYTKYIMFIFSKTDASSNEKRRKRADTTLYN